MVTFNELRFLLDFPSLMEKPIKDVMSFNFIKISATSIIYWIFHFAWADKPSGFLSENKCIVVYDFYILSYICKELNRT